MLTYASVALVDPRGWVLMQERDEHPVLYPGCWGLPGGAVEVGETPEQAAYRELEEETEVRLDGGLVEVVAVEVPASAVGAHRCHVYGAATTLTDADIVCHEGRRIVFVDPARVPGLSLTDSAARAWPALLASETYAAARAR